MKYTALLALGAMLTGSAFSQEKIVIKGSDTLGAKMVPQLKEAYIAAGNKVDFEIAAEGSSQAFSNLIAGTADIGMSSRDAKEKEINSFTAKGQKLVEHVAGWDMIAVVTNKENGVRKLTTKQIEGIFTGDITDWSEVGGKSGKISVYTRNTTSGTYKTFQGLAMAKRDYSSNSQKMAGNEQIATEVAGNVNGIGYVGLAYAGKDGLRALKVDDVSPKPKNKADYPLSRKLFYYTVNEPTGEAKKFLDWSINSAAAKEIIAKVGFIPVD
ncbi:phosphate ABC transporter substrate-binding protein [Akkermansiaceae bacterium]|nr:phosphate ABC transporter substrate-binding protein [Akkermansiaceae bacterium]MDB4287928.1 phosphate ABC transporter substrate-binding protein [bacterium]MDA7675203.1 phosphate ABC transporter substrate-binding protein [Akkermansiaceae bacterium]MDA7877029.1 phosphate ABC transporter substrate-binding protein [Akkermansiaceae bacterium]MDB4143528.1 phosphate ABC transporter substrate-binding protein [Akkermansiaceae bacterium]